MLHQVSGLWPIYALHHSAGRMHVLKGGRLHVFDLLSRYLVVFAPLLGVPRPLVLWYAAALLMSPGFKDRSEREGRTTCWPWSKYSGI